MRKICKRAALLAATGLLVVAAGAKEAPPPADPKAVALVSELGLAESPTALRDLPGWRAPRRIVMVTQNPFGSSAQELRARLVAAAPGLEVVTVGGLDDLVKEAGTADAVIGGDDLVCNERVRGGGQAAALDRGDVRGCRGLPRQAGARTAGSHRHQHARGGRDRSWPSTRSR